MSYWRFRGRILRVQMYPKKVLLDMQFELPIQFSVESSDKNIDMCTYICFEICHVKPFIWLLGDSCTHFGRGWAACRQGTDQWSHGAEEQKTPRLIQDVRVWGQACFSWVSMAKIEESVIKTSENSSHIWCAPRDVFQGDDQPSTRSSKSQIFPLLFVQVTVGNFVMQPQLDG